MYISFGKRLFDLALSILALAVVIPVLAVSILFILIVDGYPFFFVQKRMGKNGNEFVIYKLRTMRKGADKLGATTYKNDYRIIWGGALIRSLKIDELPQLINIVKGDMSIVGPRPTVKEDYDRMSTLQKQRAAVLPGLTGLAQISGNTSLTWPERIELDLKYIQKLSFFEDLKIILATAKKLIINEIDSHPPTRGEW